MVSMRKSEKTNFFTFFHWNIWKSIKNNNNNNNNNIENNNCNDILKISSGSEGKQIFSLSFEDKSWQCFKRHFLKKTYNFKRSLLLFELICESRILEILKLKYKCLVCWYDWLDQRFSKLGAWQPTKGYWKKFDGPPNTFNFLSLFLDL